jgi:hypothetical protein
MVRCRLLLDTGVGPQMVFFIVGKRALHSPLCPNYLICVIMKEKELDLQSARRFVQKNMLDLTRTDQIYIPGVPVYSNGLKALVIGNMYWFVFIYPVRVDAFDGILILEAHVVEDMSGSILRTTTHSRRA